MKLKFIYVTLIYFTFISKASSQDLTTFIKEGITSNTMLQQKHMTEEVAKAALNEAKKMKSLKVDFAPTYTLAAGGRTIDVPVGDLLNPIYGTLNELTSSQAFPQIENASELLNPNNFYDLRLRASYPIINKEIDINKEIKEAEIAIASLKVESYKDQLMKDISTAYYDVHLTQQAIEIYKSNLDLVEEVLRVNRGLLKVGKAIPIDVYTAEDDSLQLATEYTNAFIAQKNASAYLNFLTNRALDSEIKLEDLQDLPTVPVDAVAGDRPELRQLNELIKIQHKLGDLSKAASGPKLNAFVDGGLQDFNFNIDGQSPYVIAGVAFSINIFDGGVTKSKVNLAKAKIKETEAMKNAVEQSIDIETYTTLQSIEAAINSYEAAKARSSISEKRYKQALLYYKAGKTNYLDVQQLRNNLLTSQLQENIARFDIYKQVSEYNRILSNEMNY